MLIILKFPEGIACRIK